MRKAPEAVPVQKELKRTGQPVAMTLRKMPEIYIYIYVYM